MILDDLAHDPYPILAELRAREPVAWMPDVGMWFVTRYDDTLAVLSDPDTFRTGSNPSLIEDTFGRMMLSVDGDEQHRLRHPASQPFTPRAIREHATGIIDRLARELAAAIEPDGKADLVAAFAEKLALGTVAEILGLHIGDHDLFRAWYRDFADGLANFTGDPSVRARAHASAEAFRTYTRPILDRPPDGSVLAAMRADGRMSDDEICSAAMLILFGGLETTQAMLANTIWALLTHPGADRTDMRAVIEESLRWEAPVQSCTRHASRDTVLHGVAIAEGQAVQCLLGAANRDPDRFADPDTFDPRRPNAGEHLSFGAGRHFCIGAMLARQEGIVGLPILFERLAGLRLAEPSAPYGYEFRSPPALHCVWG